MFCAAHHHLTSGVVATIVLSEPFLFSVVFGEDFFAQKAAHRAGARPLEMANGVPPLQATARVGIETR